MVINAISVMIIGLMCLSLIWFVVEVYKKLFSRFRRVKVQQSSGNVFKDIGLPDAEQRLERARSKMMDYENIGQQLSEIETWCKQMNLNLRHCGMMTVEEARDGLLRIVAVLDTKVKEEAVGLNSFDLFDDGTL